jgi:muramoyltetrapeptide carboxypeptidase LdcA involved in peptidoglycan recycling
VQYFKETIDSFMLMLARVHDTTALKLLFGMSDYTTLDVAYIETHAVLTINGLSHKSEFVSVCGHVLRTFFLFLQLVNCMACGMRG